MIDLTPLWAGEFTLEEIDAFVFRAEDPRRHGWCSVRAPVHGPDIIGRSCVLDRKHIGPHMCASGLSRHTALVWD